MKRKIVFQARNSAGECHLDMVEVGGSKPPAPTRIIRLKFIQTAIYDFVLAFTFSFI